MPEPDLSDLSDYQAKDPQQALDDALATVRAYCGWHVSPSQAETVSVWSADGRTIVLETLNLTAVTSITQDAALVPVASYTFDANGVIRAATGAIFGRSTKLTVVFTHGYADLPDDVKGVALSLAQRSISDTRGMVPRTGAGASVVVMEQSAQLTHTATRPSSTPTPSPPVSPDRCRRLRGLPPRSRPGRGTREGDRTVGQGHRSDRAGDPAARQAVRPGADRPSPTRSRSSAAG